MNNFVSKESFDNLEARMNGVIQALKQNIRSLHRYHDALENYGRRSNLRLYEFNCHNSMDEEGTKLEFRDYMLSCGIDEQRVKGHFSV